MTNGIALELTRIARDMDKAEGMSYDGRKMLGVLIFAQLNRLKTETAGTKYEVAWHQLVRRLQQELM